METEEKTRLKMVTMIMAGHTMELADRLLKKSSDELPCPKIAFLDAARQVCDHSPDEKDAGKLGDGPRVCSEIEAFGEVATRAIAPLVESGKYSEPRDIFLACVKKAIALPPILQETKDLAEAILRRAHCVRPRFALVAAARAILDPRAQEHNETCLKEASGYNIDSKRHRKLGVLCDEVAGIMRKRGSNPEDVFEEVVLEVTCLNT